MPELDTGGIDAAALAAAITDATPYPPFPEGLDLERATELQAQVVAILSPNGPGGLKAGVTVEAAQAALGVPGPLLGHLHEGRGLESGCALPADEGVKIECEVGVRIGADGTIRGIRPVIELARLDWASPSDFSGPNLLATNIAADRSIVGAETPWSGDPTDGIVATRSGEVFVESTASFSLGGPTAAVAWLLEEAPRRGFEIPDDVLFITGACGAVESLTAGDYVVDYGSLGTVEFTAS